MGRCKVTHLKIFFEIGGSIELWLNTEDFLTMFRSGSWEGKKIESVEVYSGKGANRIRFA